MRRVWFSNDAPEVRTIPPGAKEVEKTWLREVEARLDQRTDHVEFVELPPTYDVAELEKRAGEASILRYMYENDDLIGEAAVRLEALDSRTADDDLRRRIDSSARRALVRRYRNSMGEGEVAAAVLALMEKMYGIRPPSPDSDFSPPGWRRERSGHRVFVEELGKFAVDAARGGMSLDDMVTWNGRRLKLGQLVVLDFGAENYEAPPPPHLSWVSEGWSNHFKRLDV